MNDQTDLLLGYLKANKTITAADAMNVLGIGRLSARIFDLRAEGYDISLTIKTGTNRFGKPVHYGVYRLEAAPNGEGQLYLL